MRTKFYLLLFIITPGLVFALPQDKTKPLHIQANTADFSQKTGESIFTGNVIITQGSTKITAAQISTYTDKKNHLSKAIATGHPATYETLPKKDSPLFKASANTIKYLPLQNKVILIGHSKLDQGKNALTSNYIVYNQKNGHLQTKMFHKQRTIITIKPNK